MGGSRSMGFKGDCGEKWWVRAGQWGLQESVGRSDGLMQVKMEQW